MIDIYVEKKARLYTRERQTESNQKIVLCETNDEIALPSWKTAHERTKYHSVTFFYKMVFETLIDS